MRGDRLGAAWPVLLASPQLGEQQVDIIAVDLRHPMSERDLSADELASAARFRLARDRTRYIAAHAALRAILAKYLSVDTAEVRYSAGALGKPRLDDVHTDLRFSLTCSADLALVAVCRGHEIGVDVERVDATVDPLEVSASAFADVEHRRLVDMPEGARCQEFFALWTRKEAYLKAIGTGLSRPMASFAVGEAVDGVARLLWDDAYPEEAPRWRLLTLRLGDEYRGAVAVPGDGWQVRGWRLGE